MKRLIVIILFSISTMLSFAQTAGIELSPGVSFSEGANLAPGFGFSGGFYYDQPIYKKSGISTGILYTRLGDVDRSPACLTSPDIPCPDQIRDQFGIIEIPIDFTMDVTMPQSANWKVYLKVGYSFGYIVRQQRIRYFSDKNTSREIVSRKELRSHTHFFRTGFEAQRSISEKINIAMGSQYKFTSIYQRAQGGFNNFNFFLKMGYNFSKATED